MAREMDLQIEGYEFTRNWFRTRNLATFREFVFPEWAGKRMTYLEIGVFEGMSMCWMIEHVLTHPDSRAVGVDPWLLTTKLDSLQMTDVMVRAFQNVRVANSIASKAVLIRGSSVEVLRKMVGRGGFMGIRPRNVDLCMVDGDHNRLGAYDDARMALRLVRPGGWILFDDVENDKPKEDHVRAGLDMFLEEFGDSVKQVWKHRYMECYEVVK